MPLGRGRPGVRTSAQLCVNLSKLVIRLAQEQQAAEELHAPAPDTPQGDTTSCQGTAALLSSYVALVLPSLAQLRDQLEDTPIPPRAVGSTPGSSDPELLHVSLDCCAKALQEAALVLLRWGRAAAKTGWANRLAAMLATGDFSRQATAAYNDLRRAFALLVGMALLEEPICQWPAPRDVPAAVVADVRALLREGRLDGAWQERLQVGAAAGWLADM
jgi:hypothetical protein